MSTTGGDLQLMSCLDAADWTMGKVSKGNRSKRSSLTGGKKRVARKFGSQNDVSVGKVDDCVGSDTEKQGVAILGCRFSEKVENIPIKKRRSLALSSLRQFGVADLNLNGKRQRKTADTFSRTKLSTEVLKENGDDDKSLDGGDFFGIEILADVACNDGMIGNGGGDDDHDNENSLKQELTQGVDSSASAVRPEEIAMSPGHLVSEDKFEALSHPDSVAHLVSAEKTEAVDHPDRIATVLRKSETPTNSNTVTEEFVSSQSQRLHWDLNVTMDAWEQPYSTFHDNQEENSVQCIPTVGENLPILDGCKSQEKSKVLMVNSVGGVQSISIAGSEIKQILEGCVSQEKPKDIGDNSLGVGSSQDCHNSSSEEAEYKVLGHIDRNHNDHLPSTSDNVLTQVVKTVDRDVCVDPSPLSHIVLPGSSASENSGKAEALDASPCKERERNLSVMSEINRAAAGEDVQASPDEDVQTAADMQKDVNSVKVVVSADRREVELKIQANDLGDCDLSPRSRLTSVKDVNCVNIMGKPSEEKLAVVSSTPANFGFKELIQKSSTGGTNHVNLTAEDNNSNETFESDVCQADKVDLVGTDEVHTGYGSQFEDGELRESDARSWDGEVEQLDYGSDCDEEEELQFQDGGLGNNNDQKFTVESGSSDNVTRKTTQCGTGVGLIRSDKDYYQSGVSRSRESEREPLQVEGIDGVCRKDAMRSRDDIYSNFYSRDERESSSRRYIARDRASSYGIRGRSPRDRDHQRFFNSSSGYWGSDCSYSHASHGGYAHRPGGAVPETRRTYIASNNYAESGFGGGFHRSIIRRRSPSNRDEASRWPDNGPLSIRDNTSPVRSRLRKFPQWRNRGSVRVGEEYQRPILENDTGYSSRMSRRERSVSPIRGRPHYISTYKKSWSRSRSRSPVGHLPMRERNVGLRLRSRSPDFRFNDRAIHRERPSFQKRFAPEHEEGFVSSARAGWFSPQRDNGSRWFTNRSDSFDDFERRKPQPMGAFRRGQRLDAGSSIRRFDSDDKFRPHLRKARQEGEYDHIDDERERNKHRNRYEMIDCHRIRD